MVDFILLTSQRPYLFSTVAYEFLGNEGWNWPEFLKYLKKVLLASPRLHEIRCITLIFLNLRQRRSLRPLKRSRKSITLSTKTSTTVMTVGASVMSPAAYSKQGPHPYQVPFK